jgi:hypothetical protein
MLATTKGELPDNLWNQTVARFVFWVQNLTTIDLVTMPYREAVEFQAVMREYYLHLQDASAGMES